jgi:HNH endonuclease
MSVYISTKLQQKIRGHFHHCCGYCHTSKIVLPVSFEFEHIVPLVAGGKTVFENLCFSCPMCNRYKAARQAAIDPETGVEVALFHPQQDKWKEHFVWKENFTVLEGLTAKGRTTTLALKLNRLELVEARKLWVKVGKHPPSFEDKV